MSAKKAVKIRILVYEYSKHWIILKLENILSGMRFCGNLLRTEIRIKGHKGMTKNGNRPGTALT
jgi:hypothetical protein